MSGLSSSFVLSLLFLNLFFLCWAQEEEISDFKGKKIKDLIKKQHAITFDPTKSPSTKNKVNYEEFGFELAFPARPRVTLKGVPEGIIYKGTIRSIRIELYEPSAVMSKKKMVGSWLKNISYKHTPFRIVSYKKGLIGQCFTENYYKVGFAQTFKNKSVLLTLSMPLRKLESDFLRIQEILNGFGAFGTSKNQEEVDKTDKTEETEETEIKATVEEETTWTPPSKEEIKKALLSLPGNEREKFLYLGHSAPAKIYAYFKEIEGNEKPLQINPGKTGYLGNLTSFFVLLEAVKAIGAGKLSKTEKFPLTYQTLFSPMLSKEKIGAPLRLDFLLQSMVRRNDQSAVNLVGDLIGWEKIQKSASKHGASPVANLFSPQFKYLLYSNQIKKWERRSLESKIESWNLYSKRKKKQIIKETLEKRGKLTPKKLNSNYQKFMSKLSFEEKRRWSEAFGVKIAPKIFGEILAQALKSEYHNKKASEALVSFLLQNQSDDWFKPFPKTNSRGVMIGSEEGIMGACGFAKLSNGKTIVFCFLSDSLKEKSAIKKLKNNVYLMFYIASRIYNK